MESMLGDASAEGVCSIVLRAGDFFGPGADSSWFSQAIARGGRDAKRIIYPGRRDAGHSWAYLPDMAAAVARLLAVEDRLATGETVHVRGRWIDPGLEMAETACAAIGRTGLPIIGFPRFAATLAAPFVTFLREARKMHYLSEVSIALDNARLTELIGPEPHTPLPHALAATLDWMSPGRALHAAAASPVPA